MLSRLSAISGIAARQYTSQNSLLRAGTLSAYKSPFHTSPHNMVMDKIVYTHADEAPALATYSLLPIIQRFAKPLGVSLNKITDTSFHCYNFRILWFRFQITSLPKKNGENLSFLAFVSTFKNNQLTPGFDLIKTNCWHYIKYEDKFH